MPEQAPQSEKKYGDMVPEYVFDKVWQDANFSVPTNDEIRKDLREKLEGFTHYGVMHLSENQKAMDILKARVAAIDAYDAEIPKAKNEKVRLESRKERIAALSSELIESGETFPFPGIDPEMLLNLKADIARDEEQSGYTMTMFDKLVERFKNEGVKVTLGKYPESGNVFVLPSNSNDIENDNIFPKHLQTSGIKEKLEELVLLKKQVRSFEIRA